MCFVDESGHGKRAHNRVRVQVRVLELAYGVEFRSQNGFGSPVAHAAWPSALPALLPLPDSPPSSVDSHSPSALPNEHVPSTQMSLSISKKRSFTSFTINSVLDWRFLAFLAGGG